MDSILHDNSGLREAARLYNFPVETLRRHVNGSVEVGARPGTTTILMDEKEDMLVKYLVEMADMEYGLTRKTVMNLHLPSFRRVSEKIPSWWKGWSGMVRRISMVPPTVIFTSSTATLLLLSHFLQPSNS